MKHSFLGPTSRISDLIGQGPRRCSFNKFPDTDAASQGPHFKGEGV